MWIYLERSVRTNWFVTNIQIISSVRLHRVWNTSTINENTYRHTFSWPMISAVQICCSLSLVSVSEVRRRACHPWPSVSSLSFSDIKTWFPRFRCPLISWSCCSSGGLWIPRKISSFYSNSFPRNLLIYQVSIFGFL